MQVAADWWFLSPTSTDIAAEFLDKHCKTKRSFSKRAEKPMTGEIRTLSIQALIHAPAVGRVLFLHIFIKFA